MTTTTQAATEYEVVIGLEVHSQLLTESKMFCAMQRGVPGRSTEHDRMRRLSGSAGALPVMNRRAVDYVIRTGLVLGCDISGFTQFDRKNYPYPDLMKGYQISQYDLPIAYGGCLNIETDSGEKSIGVTRSPP